MTDEQWTQLRRTITKATKEFRGDITQLEAAIGLISMTEHLGWKPMLLVHDARTVKKYEDIIKLGYKD